MEKAAIRPIGVPLTIALQVEIDAALARLASGSGERCLSDWTYSNLFLFRSAHQYRYLPGPRSCIAGQTYDGVRHLFPLFPLHDLTPADAGKLLGDRDCFYPLAQSQVDRLEPDAFEWTASPDDADYLYPADNFRGYQGAALNKKRNLMKQLLAKHVVETRPYSETVRDEAMSVLRGWMCDKRKTVGEADEAACEEALLLAKRLGFEGFVYRVEGTPAGFVLAQELQPGVFAMRFAKGLDRFKGIYQYMFHHFCVSFSRTVNWLNFEQDMGLENFRRTKKSYRPAQLLPKYRVRPR